MPTCNVGILDVYLVQKPAPTFWIRKHVILIQKRRLSGRRFLLRNQRQMLTASGVVCGLSSAGSETEVGTENSSSNGK